jgi:hypothetical protein
MTNPKVCNYYCELTQPYSANMSIRTLLSIVSPGSPTLKAYAWTCFTISMYPNSAQALGYETRILQPIVYRIPGYVSDTDTRWYVFDTYPWSIEKINVDKLDTCSDVYWAPINGYVLAQL